MEEQQADNNLILYIILVVVLLAAVLIISLYLVRLNNRKLKFVHNLKMRNEGETDLQWGQRRKPISSDSNMDITHPGTDPETNK